jgi:heme oxygenase
MTDDMIMQAILSGWISMAEKAKNRMEDLKRERDDLESKLDKAVEALREIVSKEGYMNDPWEYAATVLAELEGK